MTVVFEGGRVGMRMRLISGVVSVGVVLGAAAQPGVAAAAQVVTTDCNFDFKETFNKGDAVCVTGDVDVVPPGKILPEARFHVIPVDHPNPFADVSGGVNLIQGTGFGGAFYDQFIWLPELKAGKWEIVLDHHPYGTWTGTDLRTGHAFTVSDAPTVFSVDPAAIKAAAAIGVEQAKAMKRLALYLTVLDTLSTAADWTLAFGPIGGLVGLAVGGVCYATGTDCPTSYNSAVITIGTKIIGGHAESLQDHYQGIVDDPPDPNFGVVVALNFGESIGKGAPHTALAGQEIPTRQTAAAAAMIIQVGAYEALVPSLEKLQGAQIAKNNLGMLIQAEKVKSYAQLAISGGDRMVAELTALEAFLNSKGTLNSGIAAAEVQANIDALAEGGLVGEDRDQVYSFGYTDAQIDAGIALLTATPLPPTLHYGALIDEARASFVAVKPALLDLVAQTDKMITENTPLVVRVAPKASVAAAQPGAVGQAMSLSADATHFDASAVLTYRWDTDMDGVFDDGLGKSIMFTPGAPGPLVVSVEVKDNADRRDVAHRVIEVEVGNHPPEITALSPVEVSPFAALNEAMSFTVEAVDPDGDPLTFTWRVDGVVQGQGADFAFTMPDEAPHKVLVTVADDDPYSPDASALRIVRASKWEPGGGVDTDTDTDTDTGSGTDTDTSGGTDSTSSGSGGETSAGSSGDTDGSSGSSGSSGGSGGTDGSGGSTGSGGSAGSAGSAGTGGATDSEGTSATDSAGGDNDAAGCACAHSPDTEAPWFGLGGLGLLLLRRRGRARGSA
jgi:MYXO-CTERM domain-containing protein